MPTHAICDDEQTLACVRRIFVLWTEVPGVSGRAEPWDESQVLSTLKSDGNRPEHDRVTMIQTDGLDDRGPIERRAVGAAFVDEPPTPIAPHDLGVHAADRWVCDDHTTR